MDLLTGKFATDFGYVFEFEYGDMSRCLLYCNTKQFINSMQRFLPDFVRRQNYVRWHFQLSAISRSDVVLIKGDSYSNFRFRRGRTEKETIALLRGIMGTCAHFSFPSPSKRA
jgi:hypothetical protein